MSTTPVSYNNPATQTVIPQQYPNKNNKTLVTSDQTTDPELQKYNRVFIGLLVYASVATMFCLPIGIGSLLIANSASKGYKAGTVKKAVRLGITSGVLSTISIAISVTLILAVIIVRIVFTV